MSDQFAVALKRGLWSALVTGGGVFFTVIATADFRSAAIATGAAIFTTLSARVAVEGSVDTASARRDDATQQE